MSLAYCRDCGELMYSDECENNCGNPSGEVVYGDIRAGYVRGYRDCENGKEMDV